MISVMLEKNIFPVLLKLTILLPLYIYILPILGAIIQSY